MRQRWTKRKLTTKIFHSLRYNERPIDFSKDQGRDLRKKAQKFVLEDGALFFIGQKNGQPERWVHSRDEQQEILKACHSNKLAKKGLYKRFVLNSEILLLNFKIVVII